MSHSWFHRRNALVSWSKIPFLFLFFTVVFAFAHEAKADNVLPAVGSPCSLLGETGMTQGATDIVACLHDPTGHMLIWYRAGTNSIPVCGTGYALNFDGAGFVCSLEVVKPNFPICPPSQALSYDGANLVCVTPTPPPAVSNTTDNGAQNGGAVTPVGTLTTVTTVTCTLGSTFYGTVTNGVFAACGSANDPSCQDSYVCTVDGLQ